MLHAPWPIYAETQLAACGIAIMDNTIARALRPTLFIGGSGASEDFQQPIERARASGTLYSAVIKTTKPDEVGQMGRDSLGIPRVKTADDRATIQVIALSASRLAERLRWFGLDVESVTPWREPEAAPEPTPEEIAAREAKRGAVRESLGIYPGHPPVAA